METEMPEPLFSFDNLLIHFLPAAFAAGAAWFGVRYELRNLRRVTSWTVTILLEIVEDHNRRHPESMISLGELGKTFFAQNGRLS